MKKSTGVTLVEVLVATGLVAVVLVPLISLQSSMNDKTRIRDEYAACAMLSGEMEALYAGNRFPDPQAKIKMNDVTYVLNCEVKPDSCLVPWRMWIERNGRKLGEVSGLAFKPDNKQ